MGRESRRREPRRRVVRVFNTQAFLVWAAIFVLFTIYFGGHLWTVMNRSTAEQIRVVLGSIDNFTEHHGIIIREERVFTAGAEGTPVRLVNEGERVRVGSVVSSIQDEGAVAQLSGQITTLNQQAINMQEVRGDLSVVEEEVTRLNATMAIIINEQSFAINSDTPNAMYNLRNSLESVFDERNDLLLSENRGALVSNLSMRSMATQQLSGAKYNMSTDVSGIVSFRVDGLEQTLTTNRLSNLTVETTRQRAPIPLPVVGSVNEGTPVFKIITSNTWYIAAYIDIAETIDWFEGMRRNIYILQNGRFVALETRVHILDNAGNYAYVVFSSNHHMADFLDMRSVVFRIDNNAMQGLMLPNSAIAERTLLVIPNSVIDNSTDVSRVMVIGSNIREAEIDITIASSNEEFSYIILDNNRLRLGDVLLDYATGGIYEITEVRIMRGVYVINAGAARFRPINMEYAVQNDGFTILNQAINRNIRVGDSIIIDVSNIEDGQLIF